MYGHSYAALSFLRRQYLAILRRCGQINVMSFIAPLALVSASSGAVGQVIADGRTNTVVTSNGNVTDVRTSTLQGGNAFNTFSQFSVLQGNVVNLFVPDSAGSLINLVRQQIQVDGIVNSFKNGHIGGNVYFASPEGFVVGQTGVLNVGSLTVRTPSQAYFSSMLSPTVDGIFNSQAIESLKSGNIPLSSDGVISVKGRIHAVDGVNLRGQTVTVDATGRILAGGQAAIAFSDLVNTGGIQPGTVLVQRGGEIVIVADGDVTMNGLLSSRFVGAGGDLANGASLADSGMISLSGTSVSIGDGGKVFSHALNAGGTTYAAGDLSINALSAVDATSVLSVSTGSAKAGISVGKDAQLLGGNVSLSAVSSIAPTHALAYDNLYAKDQNGDPIINPVGQQQLKDSGFDKYKASTSGNGFLGTVSDTLATSGLVAGVQVMDSTASIDIKDGAKIVGSGDVSLTASSVANAKASVSGLLVGAVVTVTDSKASIDVGKARIESTGGKVNIQSQNTNKTETTVSASQVTAALPMTVTANVSYSAGEARTTLADGSFVKAAGDVTVDAHQNKLFDVSAKAGGGKDSIGIGVLVGLSDVSATTDVAGRIEAGGNATVKAGVDAQTNKAAVDVVIGETTATRLKKYFEDQTGVTKVKKGISDMAGKLMASLKPAADKVEEGNKAADKKEPSKFFKEWGLVGAVAVTDHESAAKVTVESSAQIKAQGNLEVSAKTVDQLNTAVAATITDKRVNDTPDPSKSAWENTGATSERKNGISAAVMVVNQKNSAQVDIQSGAQLDAKGRMDITSTTSLPYGNKVGVLLDAIKADGSPFNGGATDQGAWSKLFNDAGKGQLFSTWASSATQISDQNGGSSPDEGVNVSGSVNVTQLALSSKVTIADGVKINQDAAYRSAGQDVAIRSRTEAETVNLAGDPLSMLGKGGAVGAKSGAGASVGFNAYDFSSETLVGNVQLAGRNVDVTANNEVGDVSIAVAGASGGRNALGGSVSLGFYDNVARAGIGSGATVNAQNRLNVAAEDETFHLNIAGAVVKSVEKSFGFSMSYNDITRLTEAYIGQASSGIGAAGAGLFSAGGGMSVTADNKGFMGGVAVAASMASDQTASNIGKPQSTSGTAAQKDKGDFGLGVSGAAVVNDLNDTTRAVVNGGANVQVGAAAGNAIEVDASSNSFLIAVSGTAAISTQDGKGAGLAGAYAQNNLSAVTEAKLETSGTVTSTQGGVRVAADNSDDIYAIAAGASANTKSKDSYQLAGSVTINDVSTETKARIANATLGSGGAAPLPVEVKAGDETEVRSIAGAATFGGKAGVGAGVSINDIHANTSAEIEAANIAAQQAAITVSATNASHLLSVAAAMGYSDKYAFDGAVAVNQIGNTTHAGVKNSTLVADQAVQVKGSDASKIETLSGTLAATKGSAALGASFGYNTLHNTTEAEIVGGSVHARSIELTADQDAKIDALVAGGAVAMRGAAIAGSVAVNTIDNTTRAHSDNADLLATGGDIALAAHDESAIRNLTGAVAWGGQSAGIGIAGSYNEIDGAVSATLSGGRARADQGSVTVEASREQSLQSLAAGGGGSTKVGVAGSVAVNRILGGTEAIIDGGAQVDAGNNILVAAKSDSQIQTIAGALGVGTGGVGVGGAVAVNELNGWTLAKVAGATTHLNAQGKGGLLSVDSGRLDGDDSKDLKDRRINDSMAGTAIVASGTDEVKTIAASIGAGGNTGVAGAVTVNLVSGSTTALLENATVDNNGAAAGQSAKLAAYHHTQVDHATGAGGLGGTAGVGLSVGTTVVSHETEAKAVGAVLKGRSKVAIDARGTNDLSGIVVGAGVGGTAGVNGSVAVTTLSGATRATVDGSTLASTEGDATVDADSNNNTRMIAGALAGGGAAGVGGTVIVSVVDQATQAQTLGNSQIDAKGLSRVQATSAQKFRHIGATAAGGGTAGVAGTVGVLVSTAKTQAAVGGNTRINSQLSGSAQDVLVAAADKVDADSKLGSLGAGGTAGVGAAADIQVIRSGATADVGGGASITAGRDINVQASNARDVGSLAGALGGGGYVGVGAGVSVVSVAAASNDMTNKVLENNLSSAQTGAHNSGLSGQMGSDYQGSGQLENKINAQQAQVSPNNSYASAPDGTAYSAGARVGSGARLVAGRDVSVGAKNRTDAGSVGAGVGAGLVGAGAGISVINVGDRSLAELGGTVRAGRNVMVSSADDQGGVTSTKAYAGGGGAVGLGAAVAVGDKSSSTTARVASDADIQAAGDVSVGSGLSHQLKAETVNVAVGAAGIGAAIATTTSHGEAIAEVGDRAKIRGANVAVNSTVESDNNVDAIAAAGGLAVAANAVVGTASDKTLARARVGNDAMIVAQDANNALGKITITADSNPHAYSKTLGVSVSGGVSVGAAVSVATVESSVEAGTGSATLIADTLDVKGEAHRSSKGNGHNAEAEATAGSGGVLVGANATVATATDKTQVDARIGDGAKLLVAHNASLIARDRTDARVDVTGLAIGGLVAAGATVGKVEANTRQGTYLGASGYINGAPAVGGTLTVAADGDNLVSGNAEAGSGALIAGSASVLTANSTSTTTTTIGGASNLKAGSVDVSATHAARYAATSDSLQASLVGGSGTVINVDNTSTTSLNVQDGAQLGSYSQMKLGASSEFSGSSKAKGGAGGVVSGNAVQVNHSLRGTTTVNIGKGTVLATLGDPVTAPGNLFIDAHNKMVVSDLGSLSMGAVIAGPYAGADLNANMSNAVNVGQGAKITSTGLLGIGTLNELSGLATADVTVYGLAAAGGGKTNSRVTANEDINIGDNVDILGYGNVGLTTGMRSDGALQSGVASNAKTTVLNNTVVPITAVLGADASADSVSNLALGRNARIRSVRNVELGAWKANVGARGEGIGKNPWLSLFSSEQKVSSQRSSTVGNLDLNNATIIAGAEHTQEVRWDGTTLDVRSVLNDIVTSVGNDLQPLSKLTAQINDLTAQKAATSDPGQAQLIQEQIDLLTQLRASTAGNLGVPVDSTAGVEALTIGNIIAGAGDVKVHADQIKQSGAKLTAYGAPTVVIKNDSSDFLVVNQIMVSAPGSGKVVSTGAAHVKDSGATIAEVGKAQSDFFDPVQAPTAPTIVIVNNYDTKLPGNNKPAPGIFLAGDIENLSGTTTITNQSGDVAQFGQIRSKQLTMNVPNGSLFVNMPGRIYGVVSPEAEWKSTVDAWLPEAFVMPGRSVGDAVAEFAANAQNNPDMTYSDANSLTSFLIRGTTGSNDGKEVTTQQVFLGSGLVHYRSSQGWSNGTTPNKGNQDPKLDGNNYLWTGTAKQDGGYYCVSCTVSWDTYVYPVVRAIQTSHSSANTVASGAAPGGISVGESLAINAKYININAPIEAGRKTDWSLQLDDAAKGEIAANNSGTGLYKLNTVKAIADGNGADAVPVVYWDRDKQRLLVDDVNAGGGGSVALTGGIINTNVFGKITVNSGYGAIDINNQTGRDIQLQRLDAGDGGKGVVKITDTLQPKLADGRYQTKWYVNEAGSDAVKIFDNSNGASSLETARLVDTVGSRSTQYNPLTGARYEWTYSYDVSRKLTSKDGQQLDASSGGQPLSYYDLQGDAQGKSGPWVEQSTPWVSATMNPDGTIYKRSEDVVTGKVADNADPTKVLTQKTVVKQIDWLTMQAMDSSGGQQEGTVFKLPTRIQLDVVNSVKADNPIPISFVGQSKAEINVNSNANVYVGGRVNNSAGTTTFNVTGSGKLLQADGGSLQAKDLVLNAGGGIGGAGADALKVIDNTHQTGLPSSVSASSGGDISLSMAGDLYAKSIASSGGNVSLTATGGIYQHTPGQVAVAGKVVNLVSESASTIGSANQPLLTQSQEINAFAPGDVLLAQADGNMNVGLIKSLFGNVELHASKGQIVAAAPKASNFTDEMADKKALWDRMGVTRTDNAQSTINGYQNQVARRYADYWQIRELASSPDSGFALSAKGIALFRPQVAEALGVANPSDAQVTAMIKARYEESRTFLRGVPGLSSAALSSKVGDFHYTLAADSALYRDMSYGAYWDPSMLGGIINAGAEPNTRPSTGGVANVSAAQGKIVLKNDPTQPLPKSETIVFDMSAVDGSFDPTVNLISATSGSSYSADQLRAFLAEAKPGTMTAVKTGRTVRVTLNPRNDLAVTAKDPVAIEAKGDYYLSANEDVILKDLSVGGILNIFAGRDVINGTPLGVAGGKAGGLYIDAGRNVGSPDNPIQLESIAGKPLTVHRIVAPGTVDMTVLNGDVEISTLEVGGTTNIFANHGNFYSAGTAHLNGGLVNLRAWDADGKTAGSIGSADRPFLVEIAKGSLGLFGKSADVESPNGDLVIADSVVDGRVSLTSDAGRIQMADAANVIRTTDELNGWVGMKAALGIGDAGKPMRLNTPRFDAETPAGDVYLDLQREAHAGKVYATDGSANIVARGDGRLQTTDLIIDDARVARRLDLQAETMRAHVTQTKTTTPLGLTAQAVGGGGSPTTSA